MGVVNELLNHRTAPRALNSPETHRCPPSLLTKRVGEVLFTESLSFPSAFSPTLHVRCFLSATSAKTRSDSSPRRQYVRPATKSSPCTRTKEPSCQSHDREMVPTRGCERSE